jgi:hypothetical protein
LTDATTAAPAAEPSPEDIAFEAVLEWCSRRRLTPVRLDDAKPGRLGVRLQGVTRSWELYIRAEEKRFLMPKVWLAMPRGLLPHVSYQGTVCVNDGQGTSLDIDRRADVVAYTLLEAFDLLEKWAADPAGSRVEFFNELEGYWSHLPEGARGRVAFEVDRRDRLVAAYVDAKNSNKPKTWVLSERGVRPPFELEAKGLAAQRALYLHLEALVPLPPAYPDTLTADFIEAVRASLSPEQQALWADMIGPSKNGPRPMTVLLSVPRAAGGDSLIGVAFTAKGGAVDAKSPVVPLTMRRHTTKYMRERGGASLDLLGKHVAVLGCGAIGSMVADALAASGVGKLTLVDHDEFSEDNVFRHLLEPLWVDISKVQALKIRLTQHYPGLAIDAVNDVAQEWISDKTLARLDGLVVAFGAPSVERSLARYFRGTGLKLPVVFTWLEALDLGGHSVLTWSDAEGCLDCLYRDDEGQPSLSPRTAYLEPDQAVTRNLTGCASVFMPFGALQARKTALMAAEHILSALGQPGPATYRFWVGKGAAAAEAGLKTTPWHQIASTVSQTEGTRRAFGRPCKRCRGKQ